MTREQLLEAFDRISVWQRGDRRAVHKPLLVLLALARLACGEAPMVEYPEVGGKLGRLLREFDPSGAAAPLHSSRKYFQPFLELAARRPIIKPLRQFDIQLAGAL